VSCFPTSMANFHTEWGPQSDSVQKRLKKVAEFYGLW
jgi:hypothetical protein